MFVHAKTIIVSTYLVLIPIFVCIHTCMYVYRYLCIYIYIEICVRVIHHHIIELSRTCSHI